MKCKFCGVEMENENLICPVCGKENVQEATCEDVAEEPVLEQELPVEENKTEKAPAEKKKTEKRKKKAGAGKTGNKVWKIAAAVILCVALVAGLVATIVTSLGIGIAPAKNDINIKHKYITSDATAKIAANRVVATIGDAKLTNAQLQVFFWSGYYDFMDQNSSYLSYLNLDTSKPLNEQKVPDTDFTWEQYFLESALMGWQQYQSFMLMAEEENFEVSADLLAYLDGFAESAEENAQSVGYEDAKAFMEAELGAGTSVEDMKHYVALYNESLEYYNRLYEAVNPSQEEIDAAFAENEETFASEYGITKDTGKLVDVRHILIVPEGNEDESGTVTYTDAQWDACRDKAQTLLDAWKAGEATEDSFAVLAEIHSEDPGSMSVGGLYQYVYEGQMVPEFEEWCFDESRQYGDTGLVKTDYGYHIMYYVYGADAWVRYTKDMIASEHCNELLTAFVEENPIKVNYRLIALGKSDLVA